MRRSFICKEGGCCKCWYYSGVSLGLGKLGSIDAALLYPACNIRELLPLAYRELQRYGANDRLLRPYSLMTFDRDLRKYTYIKV